jgi:hypothetical protein
VNVAGCSLFIKNLLQIVFEVAVPVVSMRVMTLSIVISFRMQEVEEHWMIAEEPDISFDL